MLSSRAEKQFQDAYIHYRTWHDWEQDGKVVGDGKIRSIFEHSCAIIR